MALRGRSRSLVTLLVSTIKISCPNILSVEEFIAPATDGNAPIDHDIGAVSQLQGMVGILFDEKYGELSLSVEIF